MSIAQRIENEWDHLTARLHHQAQSSEPSQPENTMTTPQQGIADSLHAITGEIAANPLISRLLQYGIGKRLTSQQADHLIALIADVEQPPQPQYTPHDDSAQFPPAGQQQ